MSDVTFTGHHEQQLRDYFGGALAGQMGVRSWAGPMLDAMAASATSEFRSVPRNEHGWEIDPIPCRPTRSGADREATELSAEAIAAVRIERRVRASLSALDPLELHALRAHYTPIPAWAPHGLESLGELRAVVAFAADPDHVRELVARVAVRVPAELPDAEKASMRAARQAARRSLDAIRAAAAKLVARARESYARAEALAAQHERDERLARFIAAAEGIR